MLFQAGRYKGSEEELPPIMAPRKGHPCPKEEEGSPGKWSDVKDSCILGKGKPRRLFFFWFLIYYFPHCLLTWNLF